ncbi:MAG: dihydrofolate reductase [Gemmatimonadales bacterium]|nr:dihydrofolate reductase [Gemmatimonadales bacterium]
MRPVRYNVASSLDGCIAGPKGEFDWIPQDPSVDFAAIFGKVDTVLLGRRSWELVRKMGSGPWKPGTSVYVFSRTIGSVDDPAVTVVADDAAGAVAALRAEPCEGDIWLFGGGTLFRSLLLAGQVDRVEVTVVPILLGGGVPLFPPGPGRVPLHLTETRRYPSGMVTLGYSTPAEPGP